MTINEKDDEGLGGLQERLQSALPPMKNREPRRDLWPLMRQRLEASPRFAFPSGVPWFDWALLGFAGGALAFFPRLIPALLYHL
jgi:hypothetical protein